MEEFYQRLSRLMEGAGLNEKNMAKLLGVTEQRLENILTGYSEADINIMDRTAQIFNVSKAYTAMMTDDAKIAEPEFAKEVYVAKSLRKGDGMITQNNVVGTVYMNRDDMHGKEYYALIAKDDSMIKARICKDDILIVRKQNTAENSDIVVAMVDDGDEIVRRYQRTGNIVTLTAEGDTMKYKTLKIDTKETKLIILGKVCEVRVQKI